MRGGVPIQGDHPRGSMLFRRPGKEPLSGDHITPFAQEKIDGVALFVDGAIKVHPLTKDLDISLIYPPIVLLKGDFDRYKGFQFHLKTGMEHSIWNHVLPNTVELHGYGKPRVNVGDILL